MDVEKFRQTVNTKIQELETEFYSYYSIPEEPDHLHIKEQILKEQELLQWVIELTYQS